MTVYVDTMEAPFRRYIMCHMFADTPEELLDMATQIGVAHKWLQTPPKASWVHFDIAKTKKLEAIARGAKLVAWRSIPAAAEWQRSQPCYARYYG